MRYGLIVLFGLLVAGCRMVPEKTEGETGAGTDSGGKAIVTVGGHEIREGDIERRFEAMIQSFGSKALSDKQIQYYRVSSRLRLIDMAIRAQLVAMECQRLGLSVTEADRQARLEAMVQQTKLANNWSEEEYEASILRGGAASVKARHDQVMADPSFNEAIEADQLLEREHPGWQAVGPEAVRSYYEQHKAGEFTIKETVRASHILISTQGLDEAGIEQARQQGMAIWEQATQPGADFAELAKRYSQCPTASQGGDVGYFIHTRDGRARPGEQAMLPAFTEAAFALEPGQISHLVKTGVGYHIIKVTDRKPARQQGFDEVKGRIEIELRQNTRKALLGELIKRLQAQVEVVWLEKESAPQPQPADPTAGQ